MRNVPFCRAAAVSLTLVITLCRAPAAPVISEIMFHPAHAATSPEPLGLEWFEIFNDGPSVATSGWRVTKGVDLVFPPGTILPANGYLVVAADVAAFSAAHPGFAGLLIGGWIGHLSNGGEKIQIEDAAGAIIDEVTYAEEGDWAHRVRSAPSLGHQGWGWENPADGGGFTIEKNVLFLDLDLGRNWKVRSFAGGSPGESFPTADNETVFITGVKTQPAIPRSTTPIVVTATIFDVPNGTVTPQWRLRWRLDGAASFQTVIMTETSRVVRVTGTGTVDEVAVTATIPAQADKAIIEYYLDAQGKLGQATWPAIASTSAPGVVPQTFGQAANCLVQVDNTYDPTVAWTPGAQPIYRLIMTAAEAADLRDLQTDSGESDSEAQMNASFIAVDGTGTDVRHLCGVRNRGNASANGPPSNYHVSFRDDDPWNGHTGLQFNCRYPHSQAIGTAIFGLAGLPVQECAPVQVRINGVNLAVPGTGNTFNRIITFGAYARVETLSGEWVAHHYPADADGNFYRVDDHAQGDSDVSNQFNYPDSADPELYENIYLKQTNQDLNDYTDLANLFNTLNNEPAATLRAATASLINLDQWLTYLAMDTLIGNSEGGISAGRTDDFSMYAGMADKRFVLIPHDFDTTMNQGVGGIPNPVIRSIFSFTVIDGLTRLFNDPDVQKAYYAKTLELSETVFNHERLDPLIDELMTGWVDASVIASVKQFIDDRRANILVGQPTAQPPVAPQIPQVFSMTSDLTTVTDGYRVTNTGNAAISGQFHVAQTRSIMVNGRPATMYYRTTGTNPIHPAGSWTFDTASVPGFLAKGITHVAAEFFDGPNGTGNLVHAEAMNILNTAGSAMTAVSATGVPQPISLALEVPATYLPGVPFLVKVDLRDGSGKVDHSLWTQTATLTASNSVTLTAATGGPAVVTLLNGRGSLLVMAGGGIPPEQTLVQPGGTSQTPNATAALWKYLDTGAAPAATWKSALGFVDTAWLPAAQAGAPGQFGAADNDERTVVANVATGPNSRKTWYFRHKFNVLSVTPFLGLTLKVVSDDGFAAYLNGTELKRQFLAVDAAHADAATTNRTGASESALESSLVPATALVAGDNLLAVEVHNAATGVDLSFDMALVGTKAATDPGNFSLTATAGSLTSARTMTSLGNTPVIATVGNPPAGPTTWSGVVRITGDLTVPAGATLTIAPGTHVLIAGTAGANDPNGADLIVNGALNVAGTEAQPVSFTAGTPGVRWGEMLFAGGTGSTLTHALITRGAHSPGRGHTGRGPVLRLDAATVTLDSCVLADSPGKAIYTQGVSSLTLRNTQIARTVTGPELENGCELLIEDSHLIDALPQYREGTNPAPDDEDTLYVHNNSNRSVVVRHSVLGRCGDDVFDCLGGPIMVENCIIREGWDKGMSLLNNNLTISGTQIIDCDKAIVPKSDTTTTRTITATNCTIVSEDHNTTLGPWGYPINPSSPDADSASTGFYTQNKSGQSNAGATLAVTAKNCILIAMEPVKIDAPYLAANTVVTYSDTRDSDQPAAAAWPGAGNINGDPFFVSTTAPTKNFGLEAGSPCRDTGDPTSPNSPDGTRADMGALPFGGSGGPVVTDLHWTLGQSPYHLALNVTIAAGSTLTIDPGVNVYVSQNRRLTVNGVIKVLGTANAHVTFSHVPGTTATGDADPVAPGTQTGPAKWGGLRIVDSMAQENIVQYADFVNAQGLSSSGSENWGSLGAIRSWLLADHCTFAGSHLRLLYGRNPKMTVQNCTFPDEFGPTEDPITFGLDNVAEPLKVEFPAADTEVQNANFVDGFPVGGWWRVYHNDFHGNKGHNDVFDADSGKWGVTTVLDCRYNRFHGLTGDEHIDLGGDAYIASNVFQRGTKDQWTSDTGHSNAMSSGDRGTGTTIMVARNRFFDVDHAINCKVGTATIFEHNTAADFHADYQYTSGPPNNINQPVQCAVVGLFIPEDGATPTVGYGGYLGFNIISNVPRLVTGADRSAAGIGAVTSKLEFNQNLVDQITDTTIGANHPGGIFNAAYGINLPGAADFANPAAADYSLAMGSAAQGTAAGELDYGATISEWAYILGGPATLTAETASTFVIGGPGIVRYQWRQDGGAWSAPITIGAGGVFPRGAAGATVRQATLTLPSLATGSHTLEVLGQDFAGNWQPSAAPTTRTWTVDPALRLVLINEVVANDGANPDWVELINAGAAAIDLGGWGLGEVASAATFVLPAGTMLQPGAVLQINTTANGLSFDKDGDAAFLFENGVVRDSIAFGPQLAGSSLSRLGRGRAWGFGVPTPAAANQKGRLGSQSGLRITEWLAAPSVRFRDDFVELHNEGALAVALDELRLTDNRVGAPTAHVMAAHSFIAPGGFLKLTADGLATAGPTHLGFRLDALQERLALLDTTGVLIDEVYFYGQTDDLSQSLSGTGLPVFNELPTPGFAMAVNDPVYLNALALQRGLRITEIMFNAAGGNDFDWIELRNVGATAFNLQGVSFVEGIDFVFGNVTLQPAQSIVLVADLAAFHSRYGVAPNIGGTYAGRLDNGGETLDLQLPAPFDANVLFFRYEDDWYPDTDGGGRSLALTNLGAAINAYDQKATWQASSVPGGTPDGATLSSPTTYASWKTFYGVPSDTTDGDFDSLLPIIEFALGLDPSSGATSNGVSGLPVSRFSPSNRLEMEIRLPLNAAAVQGHGRPEVLYEVQISEALNGWTTIAAKSPTTPWTGSSIISLGAVANGFQTITIEDTAGLPANTRRFQRLQTTWVP